MCSRVWQGSGVVVLSWLLLACSSSKTAAPVHSLGNDQIASTIPVRQGVAKSGIQGSGYTVVKGDTLYSIAFRSGMDVDALISMKISVEDLTAGNSKVVRLNRGQFENVVRNLLLKTNDLTTAPLRAATYLGVATAFVAFVYGVWIIAKALLWGDPVAGWPTMMSVILFLGGVQLVALGLIGEYLGRLYEESKQRPLYLVDSWLPAGGVSSGRQSNLQGASHGHGAATAGNEIA